MISRNYHYFLFMSSIVHTVLEKSDKYSINISNTSKYYNCYNTNSNMKITFKLPIIKKISVNIQFCYVLVLYVTIYK